MFASIIDHLMYLKKIRKCYYSWNCARNKNRMGFKDWCHVNKTLLPFKLHFFFYSGGLAGVLPFMPLIAKHIGINATALGVGYSMIPVFIFLSNPLFGLLADYFQNLKLFIIALLFISSLSYFSVLLIPSIHLSQQHTYIQISNFNSSEPLVKIPMKFEKTCLEKHLNEEINCKLILNKSSICRDINFTSFIPVIYNKNVSQNDNELLDKKDWVTFYTEDKIENSCIFNYSEGFSCMPNIKVCSTKIEQSSVFYAHQFWVFMTLAIIGGVTTTSIAYLNSAATFEVLGENTEAYGRQRLFGTISWGLMCPLAGLLNDISGAGENNYFPGFYLMAICLIIDITILCVIQVPKANYSQNMCMDLGKIVTSFEIISFAFGVMITGLLSSIIYTYEFWFLRDMGANHFLLGLTVFMQCLVGELPCMFFSGYILKKLGHFLCMVSVFAGFTLRLGFYSVLKDPWLVLPIDILHGLTFAIFHTSMVSYAKVKAPKGMEATLLSMFGGLSDGLGTCIGSFLGGVGLDNLGHRNMFLSASILSCVTLFTFLVASFCFRDRTLQGNISIPMEPSTLDDTCTDAE